LKIVAVLYPGGDAADNPYVLVCAENTLGLFCTVVTNNLR